ncbi:hypothetical protein K4F52_004081 [Lecanicillium sp. MT-2017a]|nr:hypothetical protein K4F52_004081 [Lecanicillium sp. MT-2017a]
MPPNDRPRQPAAAARALNRTPLTPKVAVAKGASVASPLARRPHSVTPTVAAAQRDDVTTPLGGFLAANVTPRSGTRQSRAESTNSTPSGTPNPDRAGDGGWEPPRSGLGIVMQMDGSPRHSDTTAESPEVNKFFYASDAKNSQPPPPRQAPAPQRGATFFYANSVAPDSNRSSASTSLANAVTSPPASGVQDPIASKFFYANGAPDLQPKSSYPNSSSNSVASSAPRIAPPARGGGPSLAGSGASSRPTSPIKAASTQPIPSLRPAMSPVSPNASQTTTSPPMAATGSEAACGAAGLVNRRVSIETPPKMQKAHSSGGGLPGNDSGGLLKLSLSPNMSEGSPPLVSPGLSQTSMTMASMLHAVDELKDDARDGDSICEPHSPTKSQFSDSVNELVANARRERKVQDLEITNASLEAINRTLERQLRKQTAELRRFRRLSRSGRLSLNSGPPSRVVSEALTDPAVDLSDVSEGESEEEDETDSLEESDVSMSDSDSVQSIGAMRRKRDEKRLQLDLTKHQELLIDSQKMNQSIKRCLNWTESLIKEGQKALEYHVRVSDVEFGGRVLAPPDDDDDDDGDDDDAPFHGSDTAQDPDATLEAPGGKVQPDRDSGIELPTPDGG